MSRCGPVARRAGSRRASSSRDQHPIGWHHRPDRITTQLTRRGCEVELITLEDIAGGLPQRASAADRLVVAGGDGSIGVTALAAHGAGLPLAVVPTGTANDFARAMGTAHDDGRLDVAVVPAGPRPSLVRRALGMRRGRLTAQRDVGHHRAHVVEVELPRRTPFNVDGDVRECEPARFDLVPGGVEVVVP